MRKKVYRWIRLSDGRLMTTHERNESLYEDYEFDTCTPMYEMWDYFEQLEFPIVVWTD